MIKNWFYYQMAMYWMSKAKKESWLDKQNKWSEYMGKSVEWIGKVKA